MKIDYRILDSDIFESYMALEGWGSFPFLKSVADEDGAMGFMMEDCDYMVFSTQNAGGLLMAVCIYQMFGEVLSLRYFEVNKDFRHKGYGTLCIEMLMMETGAKRIELDAKDKSAGKFWKSMGLSQSDFQHFYM